ncbi:MAG: TonB-dependent receptor [Chitinophagales bacterium]
MKKVGLLFSFLCAIFSISVQAQSGYNAPKPSGKIIGKAVDAKSGDALEYSSVTLKNIKDTSILLGTLVGAKGYFEIDNIPFGEYTLVVSYIGYNDFRKENISINPKNISVDLGTIKVNENSKVLNEVEITAEKTFMQLNAEKKIFNIEKNTLSAGGNAIDALKQVPMVDVDQDDNITIRGSDNIKIYINGKPSGITTNNANVILEAIPADQIESIEIINNPSAKYEAEGDVGILNINLKKSLKPGLNGSFTIGYATKYDANAGVSINYRKNKVSINTSYNFRFREGYGKGDGLRYNFFPSSTPFYIKTNDYGTRKNISNSINTSIDWDFKPKNTLSMSVLLSASNRKSDGVLHTNFLDSIANYTDANNRYTKEKSLDWDAEINTSYRRVFKDKSNDLVIAGNYAYSNNYSKPDYTQYFVDENENEASNPELYQRNRDKSISHSGFLQADYAQPFAKIKSKLELGYRFSIRGLNNELVADSLNSSSQIFELDSSISNAFKYKEMINAAYIIFGGSVKKVMDYKVGMRVEHSIINIAQKVGDQQYKQKYFDYFPSASMSFNLPRTNTISISYSKRIRRPRGRQLNPFGNYSDPYNILTGNPYLKPEYTHAVELSHFKNFDLKNGKKDSTFRRSIYLSTSIYYRYAYNVFTRFNIVDSLGRSIVNFDNLSKGQNIGVEFTGRFALWRWWNFTLSANLFQNKITGNVPNGELNSTTNAFRYDLRLDNNFNINKKASLQFMVLYRSKIKFLQGTISPMVFANIGFKYDFLKNNRASIAINISDVFHTQKFSVKTEGNNYTNTVNRYWESTVGRIVFTYKFGKSDGKSMYGKQKKTNNFEDDGGGVEGGGGGGDS